MYVWKHLPVTFRSDAGTDAATARTSRRCTTGRRRVTLATREFEAEARVAAKHEVADGVVA